MLPLDVMALRVGDRLPEMEPFVPETTRLRNCGMGDAVGAAPAQDPLEADAALKTDPDASASAEDSEVEKDSRQRLTVDFRPKMGFVNLASAKWKGPNN